MAERRLWAPWRIEYITGPKPDRCVFCTAAEAEDDAAAYVVHRGERCFAMLNAYPYAGGHLMVSPYRHVPGLEQLADGELFEMMVLSRHALRALGKAFGPDGFNVGINEGSAAGAGVEDHVHQHVVPRWGGDTNFMPVIGHTRVLPELLEETYDRLRPVFAES